MDTAVDSSRRTSFALINRVKNLNDHEGWDQFYQQYRQLVLSIGRQHGLSESEAEELGQEVFLRVARNIGVFETGGRPGAFRRWLGQLTTWCAIDAQRKPRLPTSPLESDFDDDDVWASERIADPGSVDPLAETSDRDFLELILKRLKQLVSLKDFEIFCLITVEGWTPVQVADHLNVRRGMIDTSLCRTRKTARQELGRLGESVG